MDNLSEHDTLPIDPADVFATMSSEELVSILTRACDSIQPISAEVAAVLALLREAGKRITLLQSSASLLRKADDVVALALTQRDAYKVDLQEMEAERDHYRKASEVFRELASEQEHEVRHLTGKLDACEQHVVILRAERVRHAQEHHGEG